MASAAVAALAAAGTVEAQDASSLPGPERYGLRLQYREYRPGLTGEAQKGFEDRDGSVVDLADQLGVADKRTFDARGAIQFKPGWKLRGLFMPLDYDGNQEITSGFDYGETRYSRFDQVVTSIKGNYFGGDLEWDVVKGSFGYLGLVAGGRALDVDTVLLNNSTGSREVDTTMSPLPVVGVSTRLYAGKLSFEGELAGMSAGSRGSTFEAEGSVRIHFSDRFAAVGGYRHLSVEAKDGSERVQLKMNGWQFGLELSL
jgi:hypothetical protein